MTHLFMSITFEECGWRDLNSQGRSHMFLRHARIPIPPHPQVNSVKHQVTLIIMLNLLSFYLMGFNLGHQS